MKKLGWVLIALCLSACGDGEFVEVGRVTSPDQGLDAIVLRTKAEGNSAAPFQVTLGKVGKKGPQGGRLFLGDHGDTPTVEWIDSEHLVVHCKSARIWTYRNFWVDPDTQAVVSVALACGDKGWQAP
jgi:hypothetical protein